MKGKTWLPWVKAVSGGGRGLKGSAPGRGDNYGHRGERENLSRFANAGGQAMYKDAKGHLKKLGDGDTVFYGTIPNGLFRVMPEQQHPKLGRAMALKAFSGTMYGRAGFYIHGQGEHGSAGCIVPVNGKLGFVLDAIGALQLKAPVYLRVEGNSTRDLPDDLRSVANHA